MENRWHPQIWNAVESLVKGRNGGTTWRCRSCGLLPAPGLWEIWGRESWREDTFDRNCDLCDLWLRDTACLPLSFSLLISHQVSPLVEPNQNMEVRGACECSSQKLVSQIRGWRSVEGIWGGTRKRYDTQAYSLWEEGKPEIRNTSTESLHKFFRITLYELRANLR